MALSKERLENFRKELITRRANLVNGLHQTNAEMIDDEASYADSIDQASVDSDKTLALQIKNRDAAILSQIDLALRRIDIGNFGECEQCGEEIALARMKANPATTLCIDCKAELENEEQRFSRQA